ncbi:autophagy protein Apg6-domain-containing protein [Multifurca ochricompacta]|uniref:Autophagy protein Apg6-domain-containing protein n=1 Tax=Multifurca ochricompacta TaxID=376703 RepID=A0AAD4QIH8_9AGAM|nr:autophagy protein Apg6-domain-containing protein [Multifurca ochricompacta]
MAFICQQCKQPLQLDASLVDLAPSAYDTIVGSLPPQQTIQPPPPSEAEKLSQLSAPSSAKAAWRSTRPSSGLSHPPLSPRAQGKLPQRSSLLPNESFVILQDSVINNIPSHVSFPSQVPKSSAVEPGAAAPRKELPAEEVDPVNPSPLSHHLRSTQRLLNLLSSRTDIDHPLCAECTHIYSQISRASWRRPRRSATGTSPLSERPRKKRRERRRIARLKEDERIVIEQLREAELEREQLAEELRSLELEEKSSRRRRKSTFWRSYNAHLLRSAEQNSQLASLRATYAVDSATLERLERTNVYNDAFCIGHDGVFGTINSLRLGRVPGVPVEWAEINAAWGQTLLLLYTIARKLTLHSRISRCSRYPQLPPGSHGIFLPGRKNDWRQGYI